MKRIIFVLGCLLPYLTFVSCSKDENDADIMPSDVENTEVPEGYYVDPTGMLIDGESISRVGFYCLEKNPASPWGVWFEYFPKTKTFTDYSEMYFCLWLHDGNGRSYWENTIENYNTFGLRLRDYYMSKTSFIVDALKKYLEEAPDDDARMKVRGPDGLYSAYTNGEVTLTCDKTLWGEAPGTNLSKYFMTYGDYPSCLVVGVESPRLLYGFGEEMPTTMDALFPDEAWLLYRNYWEMQTPPSEKYDELTFTLTMPVLIEHSRKYVYYQYMGMNLDSKYSEQTFTATCTMRFDWK